MRIPAFILIFHICISAGGQSDTPLHWKDLSKQTGRQWLVTAYNAEYDHSAAFKTFKLPHKHPFYTNYIPGLPLPNPLADSLQISLTANNNMLWRQIKSLSDLYFPLFEKKLESLEMDADYKYLAVLLSGLNAEFEWNGRSGLWQLDFAVSKKYGLRVDENIDERNIPDRSTDVALIQLLFLQEKYEGDRMKIIAAFCAGATNVAKAEISAKENDITFIEALDHHSKAYLYFFEAIRKALNSCEAPNALIDYIELLNRFENVVFLQDVDYTCTCDLFQLNEDATRSRNPAFVGEVIPGMYRNVPFILPASAAKDLKSPRSVVYTQCNPKALKAPLLQSENTQSGELKGEKYEVQAGDNLWGIARNFPGVSAQNIMDYNHIGEALKPGQIIVIPPSQ